MGARYGSRRRRATVTRSEPETRLVYDAAYPPPPPSRSLVAFSVTTAGLLIGQPILALSARQIAHGIVTGGAAECMAAIVK
jgi:hypothetical protein